MPINNGTKINDFLSKQERPDIIFVTAYDSFAIEAIRLGAFDYIVKPIDRELFNNVLDRYFEEKDESTQEDRLSIVTHKGTSLIKFDDILFLSASGSYTEVVTSDKKIIASKPIKYFEERLPQNFTRMHRSHIINTDKVSGLNKKDSNWWVAFEESSIELPISRKYKS
jgi:DNA-binding LytR/AlgR family response regulator